MLLEKSRASLIPAICWPAKEFFSGRVAIGGEEGSIPAPRKGLRCSAAAKSYSHRRQFSSQESVLCPRIVTRGNSKNRFSLRLTPVLPRPIVAHILFGSSPVARASISSGRKPDYRAARVARRPDYLHDHGLRRGGESANPCGRWHARRWRAVCHLHLRRGHYAHHGAVGQLSHRARARHFPQRLLHLFP